MTVMRILLGTLTGAAGVLGLVWVLGANSAQVRAEEPAGATGSPAKKPDTRVSVEVARGRATLMHDVYSATLDSMHHHFFRRDRAVLPARAMEDVFEEIDKKSGIKTRWIAVNTPAMSIHHEAKSAFEKKAAEAIAGGKESFEQVEKGYYYRAGAITLGASCIGCHTKFAAPNNSKPRFAGLVIAIPVKDE